MGPEDYATGIPIQDFSERLKLARLPLQPVSRVAEAQRTADAAPSGVDADCRCHDGPNLLRGRPAVISAAGTDDCGPTIAVLAHSGAAEPMRVET